MIAPTFVLALTVLLGACTSAPEALPGDSVRADTAVLSGGAARARTRVAGAAGATGAAGMERVFLPVPPDSEIPMGPLGVSIRRGRALLEATRDSLPANVGNRLRCLSCHLDGGRRANASPLVGSFLAYPAYSARAGRVITIEDRINGCFRRSMAGRPLPVESADMRDIVSYLAFLSRGVEAGSEVKGSGLPELEPLDPDTARGRAIFASSCARCHGAHGEGRSSAPPLWGPGSFSIGAGMARLRTTASFIRYNMPYDLPGTLGDQEAFDVAAYLNSHPRPDLAGKENDWPNGDAPPDVAYPTNASKRRSEVAARSR
jgi:thiosulfate dehydrogenase